MAIICKKDGSYLEQNYFNRYNDPLTERLMNDYSLTTIKKLRETFDSDPKANADLRILD